MPTLAWLQYLAIGLAVINTVVLVLAFAFGNNLWEYFRARPRISIKLLSSGRRAESGEMVNGFCLRLENRILKPVPGVRAKVTVVQENKSTALKFPEHDDSTQAHLDFQPREMKSCVRVDNPFYNDRELPEQWYLTVRLIGEDFDKRVLYYNGPDDYTPRRVRWWEREHKKRAQAWGESTDVERYEREVRS